MFNEEQKTKFINEFTNAKNKKDNLTRLFKKTEPYETAWGIDVSSANVKQMQAVVDEIVGFRAWDTSTYINLLRAYIDWCVASGLASPSDAIGQVDTDGVEKMRSQTVRNPDQLEQYLNVVITPRNDTAAVTLKAYCWLAFSGLFIEDTLSLRSGCVDFDSMSIILQRDGRTIAYPIYRQSIGVLRACAEQEFFLKQNGTTGKEARTRRADGDLLLRTFQPNAAKKDSLPRIKFASNLAAARKRFSTEESSEYPDLTYYGVWVSGVFYRAFEAEIANGSVDFRAVATESVLRNSDSSQCTQRQLKTMIGGAAGKFNRDYERWKKTFLK